MKKSTKVQGIESEMQETLEGLDDDGPLMIEPTTNETSKFYIYIFVDNLCFCRSSIATLVKQ